MQFDFRFVLALTLVAFIALTDGSDTFDNELWRAASTTYAYQFTLGLKNEFHHVKDWRRLGLKAGRTITLEEHIAISDASPEEKDDRLRKLRQNVLAKTPAIVIQITVQSEEGVPYCMPCSYTHPIKGLGVQVCLFPFLINMQPNHQVTGAFTCQCMLRGLAPFFCMARSQAVSINFGSRLRVPTAHQLPSTFLFIYFELARRCHFS